MTDSLIIGVCAYTLIFLSILSLTEKKEEEIYKGIEFACSEISGGDYSEIAGGHGVVLRMSRNPVAVGLRIPVRGYGGAGALRRGCVEHAVTHRVTDTVQTSYTEHRSSLRSLSHNESQRETRSGVGGCPTCRTCGSRYDMYYINT